MVQDRCLDWFPRLRAISLAVEDVEAEQNEWRTLQAQVCLIYFICILCVFILDSKFETF